MKPIPICDDCRHLMCEPFSIPALHRVAACLGIGHHWFHPGRHPHYDIPKKRAAAVAAITHQVTSRELVRLLQASRRRTQ